MASVPTSKKHLLVELLIAALVYFLAAAAMSWPAVLHLDELVIGGGELGGWLWRHWWHFMELEALAGDGVALGDRVMGLLGLGRYPETGNILDVILLAWPLQTLFGLPLGYNLEIFAILILNGLCGYALARSLVREPMVALAAGLVAVVNPVVIQDIQFSGLRQVILWWVLLLPIPLARALHQRSHRAAAVAGLLLGLTAAFYWFYGLFAGLFVAIWCAVSWRLRPRPALRWRDELRWTPTFVAVTALVALPFLTPYLSGLLSPEQGNATSALPEMSFFKAFPTYEAIRDVPLRPTNAAENLLSSLNRGIMSSWSPDYIINPTHSRSLPLMVAVFGLLPLCVGRLRDRRAWAWAAVFAFFFLGTLGPFLKEFGALIDTAEVVLVGGEAIRLPWTWMFQWIPGMSRMFGPYRMGALVVVAGVALVALGMSRLPGGVWVRRVVAALSIGAALLQASLQRPSDGADTALRIVPPLESSPMVVPDFYQGLDSTQQAGIIELPLEQQQDLLYLYQRHHQRKVYRSWANRGAVPPSLRVSGGGEAGARLRYLAADDDQKLLSTFYEMSRDPSEVTLEAAALERALAIGNYRHIIVHERGYYMVDAARGAAHYERAVALLSEALGRAPEERVELEAVDYPGNPMAQPTLRVIWSSQKVNMHDSKLPKAWRMSVFDVGAVVDGYTGPLTGAGGTPLAAHQTVSAGPDLLLLVVPGLGEAGSSAALRAGFGRTPTAQFEHAYAQSVSPFLSLGSLLTGRYPSSLPLCEPPPEPGPEGWCSSVPPEVATLPERLERFGYQTHATVAETTGGAEAAWAHLEGSVLSWWTTHPGKPRFALAVAPDLGGIEEAGARLAALAEAVSAAPPNQPLWIVLTAASGVSGDGLTDGAARVPLLLYGPTDATETQLRQEVVELVDVAPTLLARGGARSTEDLPGEDLLADSFTGGAAYTEFEDELSLRFGDYLLTADFSLETASSLDPAVTAMLQRQGINNTAVYSLHDVLKDPAQATDLLQADPAQAEALRQHLLQLRLGPAAPAEGSW